MPSIAFLRPTLGVGGAERLALDAATQLQSHGWRVRFFVPGPLGGPQFDEVAQDRVAASAVSTRIPRDLGGRARAPLALVRTSLAARALAQADERFDVVFCDLVPHVIPLVRRLTRLPVVYFCHFPDLLLTPAGARASPAYRLYRRPLDWLEITGLLAADRVLVNSRFTESIVRQHVPALPRDRLEVIHPGVPIPRDRPAWPLPGPAIQVLSVNRFDPRKNLPLAIESLAALRRLVPGDVFARVRLVLAGHRDIQLPEQTRLVSELQALVRARELVPHVRLVFSPSEAERTALLAGSRCVLYTPEAEHFGYVPLEAMAAGRPVVAAESGGPAETVVDGVTGLLRRPDPLCFAEALRTFVMDEAVARRFGQSAADHVRRHFSVDAFGGRLLGAVTSALPRQAVSQV